MVADKKTSLRSLSDYDRVTARVVLCFLFLLQFAPLSFAQLYPFDHYTSKDGLLTDFVLSLCCDSRGYMWIGTNDGLSRYDGDAFRNYTIADGLALSRVTCITESRKEPGTLWIGTNGGGISKLTNEKFNTIKLGKDRASNLISAVCQDAAGNLWCGTVDGLYRLIGDDFRPFMPIMYIGTVVGIDLSADGTLWVAFPDRMFMIPQGSDTPRG